MRRCSYFQLGLPVVLDLGLHDLQLHLVFPLCALDGSYEEFIFIFAELKKPPLSNNSLTLFRHPHPSNALEINKPALQGA